ncbi:MAG: hypothetical protein HOH26_07515, partial [Alphaproteobacteria bacterium]|nr:hypothetical protein [Alphaproteobacteria bacterium]
AAPSVNIGPSGPEVWQKLEQACRQGNRCGKHVQDKCKLPFLNMRQHAVEGLFKTQGKKSPRNKGDG